NISTWRRSTSVLGRGFKLHSHHAGRPLIYACQVGGVRDVGHVDASHVRALAEECLLPPDMDLVFAEVGPFSIASWVVNPGSETPLVWTGRITSFVQLEPVPGCVWSCRRAFENGVFTPSGLLRLSLWSQAFSEPVSRSSRELPYLTRPTA